jgi:hypothetical protein
MIKIKSRKSVEPQDNVKLGERRPKSVSRLYRHHLARIHFNEVQAQMNQKRCNFD